MGKLLELWASQLKGKPALISRPSCVHRETAKHKCQRKKRKAPIILRPQEQRCLKAKMPSGQQKGRSVQNSRLKKLCCFSQQPLRQDKEGICCMAGSATTALRPDLLFQVFFNKIRSKNCQIHKLCFKPILSKLAFL